MNNPKISIIVPVYNVELYLEECLDSLIKQTYENIEIILINDGSTDKSGSICENYALKDSRIILLNQKNNGVSSARNNGIKYATGDYIMFVDADDYLEINALDKIVSKSKDNSFIIFGYNKAFRNQKVKMELLDVELNKENLERYIIKYDEINGYLWNKIFETSIIKDNKLLFNSQIHFCEDLIFVCDYLRYINDVTYISDTFYNYRMRKNSATYNFLNTKNVSILKANELLIERYKNDEVIKNTMLYTYLSNYYKFKKIIPKDFQLRYDIIKNEKQIIKKCNLSFEEKIKFVFIKRFNRIFIWIKGLKVKTLGLYD